MRGRQRDPRGIHDPRIFEHYISHRRGVRRMRNVHSPIGSRASTFGTGRWTDCLLFLRHHEHCFDTHALLSRTCRTTHSDSTTRSLEPVHLHGTTRLVQHDLYTVPRQPLSRQLCLSAGKHRDYRRRYCAIVRSPFTPNSTSSFTPRCSRHPLVRMAHGVISGSCRTD